MGPFDFLISVFGKNDDVGGGADNNDNYNDTNGNDNDTNGNDNGNNESLHLNSLHLHSPWVGRLVESGLRSIRYGTTIHCNGCI